MIERLRKLMPAVSVRTLCRLLTINRQWYYQHRSQTHQTDRDQDLCQALQELRRDAGWLWIPPHDEGACKARLEDQS
jgi:hypothetical protein